jgi:hypothetical protein
MRRTESDQEGGSQVELLYRFNSIRAAGQAPPAAKGRAAQPGSNPRRAAGLAPGRTRVGGTLWATARFRVLPVTRRQSRHAVAIRTRWATRPGPFPGVRPGARQQPAAATFRARSKIGTGGAERMAGGHEGGGRGWSVGWPPQRPDWPCRDWPGNGRNDPCRACCDMLSLL